MDCLFCKIIAGEIPSKKVYEDAHLYAFHDVAPEAPVHVLIVPKAHIASMTEITEANADVAARVFRLIPSLARELNLADGFRVVVNAGRDGGQTVGHLHFHLLGGRGLSWPPG